MSSSKLPARREVTIVCLGDIGRSPRMQYHAMSILNLNNSNNTYTPKHDYHVNIVATQGTKPYHQLDTSNKVQWYLTPKSRTSLQKQQHQNTIVKYINMIHKVLLQFFTLCYLLFVPCYRSSHLIVQNPPSIPTLILCCLICKITATKFIIDWHNLGYSIVQLTQGPDSHMTKLSYQYEKMMARTSDYNLCVTQMMKQYLEKQWLVKAPIHVLYDRPNHLFNPVTLEQKHALFLRLQHTHTTFRPISPSNTSSLYVEETLLTVRNSNNVICDHPNKARVIISSTSWTPDEDFTILLKTIQIYEKRASGPPLLFIITGKGDMREAFEYQVTQMKLKLCRVVCLFVSSEDYPILIGCADIGISLHTSSSGMDLPMKAIDMMSVNVPVCAIDFPALKELIQHDYNGYHFNNQHDLLDQITQLLSSNSHLSMLKQNVAKWAEIKFEDEWQQIVAPILTS